MPTRTTPPCRAQRRRRIHRHRAPPTPLVETPPVTCLPQPGTSSKPPSTVRHRFGRALPVTGMSGGRGPTWTAGSGWSGACAAPATTRNRTGRIGPGSRSASSTRTGPRRGSRPSRSRIPGYGRRPAFVLATEFELSGHVRSARLYATALGVYTVTINGARVGTAELSPGSTSYDRTLYAQATDVTASLAPGANRIEVELSDGWYRGQVGAFRLPAGWGTYPRRTRRTAPRDAGRHAPRHPHRRNLDEPALPHDPCRSHGRADRRLRRGA